MLEIFPPSPAVLKTLSVTGLTATVAATTFYTAPTSGLYRFAASAYISTAGTGGTLQMGLNWNNGGAASIGFQQPALTGKGGASQGTVVARVAAGTAIQYWATLASPTGSPVYALDLMIERIA